MPPSVVTITIWLRRPALPALWVWAPCAGYPCWMVLWALAEIVPILFERHARRKTVGTFVQCIQGG